jgi:vacuole morphology and inheritance protein 14
MSTVKVTQTLALILDEETQVTAMRWLNEFILLAQDVLIPHVATLLNTLLPCLAHAVESVNRMAQEANQNVYHLVLHTPTSILVSTTTWNGLPCLHSMLTSLSTQCQDVHEATRLASMDWLSMLHQKAPEVRSRSCD